MTHFSDISEDEQAWANGYVQYVSYANGNTDIIASSPIEMDSVGPLETLPSGGIGHDNDEILSRLGYDEQEIALLKEKRVI